MHAMKALLCGALALVTMPAIAASDAKPAKDMQWQFEGVTGTFNRPSIQRGFKVYREVCSSCHSLKRIAFRHLKDIGYTDDQVKSLAKEYTYMDGPNDEGEMYERPGKPSDYFPSPFANEAAARAANGGALPPDLSLIVKARAHGADYVYSLLSGYEDAPADMTLRPGMYYNPYFPGGKIGMAPPLMEGLVEFDDGTEATVEQMSKDVTNFLQWAAEPEMERRKESGLKVMLYLLIATILMYIAKRRIWSKVH